MSTPLACLDNHSPRKKKAVHKTTTTDDKRFQSTLKRIGVNGIPAIEEVNIFKDDQVIQFVNPKGLQDVLQGIINQLGFGFMLSNSANGVNFENAPFKLTRKLLEVMDSDAEGNPSEFFDYFKYEQTKYSNRS